MDSRDIKLDYDKDARWVVLQEREDGSGKVFQSFTRDGTEVMTRALQHPDEQGRAATTRILVARPPIGIGISGPNEMRDYIQDSAEHEWTRPERFYKPLSPADWHQHRRETEKELVANTDLRCKCGLTFPEHQELINHVRKQRRMHGFIDRRN